MVGNGFVGARRNRHSHGSESVFNRRLVLPLMNGGLLEIVATVGLHSGLSICGRL